MENRTILHCYLNNFYASVSLLYNQTLKNLPVAVCGDRELRHGIVLAKNDIAKEYGVKTAETIFEAKAKCPELVILPPIMQEYKRYSILAHEIYKRYTDMIEPFGIDECWLDVTGSRLLFGDGNHIAERIRNDIKHELGITVSIGVSFNKVFAKLGSDMKKPDAVTVISLENFKKTVWELPISVLLFAGKKTTQKLNSVGIFTVGDAAHCSDATLFHLLGKNGSVLKQYALGKDNAPIITPTDADKPKSVSRSVTGGKDFTDTDSVWRIFLELAQSISDTLRLHELYASGVGIHIRTASLSVKEFSKTYPTATNSAILIAKRGMELFRKSVAAKEPLRSVGISAIHLKGNGIAIQQDLFGNYEMQAEQEKIEEYLYALRRRFGSHSIVRGSTMYSV